MPATEASPTASSVWGTRTRRQSDRRSVDAAFLPPAHTSADLTRVNSTPYALDALVAQPCLSPSDSSITLAPPKPAPVDTLYPSPSGGFVPSPEEGQDWRLKPPPPGRFATASTSRTAQPTRPPSLPPSHDTASKIASASSNPASRRSSQASTSLTRRRASKSTTSRMSQSSSSTHPLSRPTSSLPMLPTLIIRDFAFDPDDVRYRGEGAPVDEQEQQRSQLGIDADEVEESETFYADADDDDEFGGDEGDAGHLVEGVYRVLYAFVPESEHELAVQPDETVHVIGAIEGGWAIATKPHTPDAKGLVPATYLAYTGPL